MGGCGSKQNGDAQQKSPNATPISPAKEERSITRQAIDFKVELTKASAEEKLGVTITKPVNGKQTLHVGALKDSGTISNYNSGQAPEKQVLVGDEIIEINGKFGDYDQMMQEITTATKLAFTVSRGSSTTGAPADTGKPELVAELVVPNAEPMAADEEDQGMTRETIEFKAELTKASAEEKLGLTIEDAKNIKAPMYVKAVKKEGAIVEYNAVHSPFGLLAGDYIMDVNGVSGDYAKMMEELTAAAHLIFTVSRYCTTTSPVTTLVDLSGSKSDTPAHALEQNPETEPPAVKSEDDALGIVESTEAAPGNTTEQEMVAEETGADGTPDLKYAKEAPIRDFDAGEGSVSVDPDACEMGPSAASTKSVCCGAF